MAGFEADGPIVPIPDRVRDAFRDHVIFGYVAGGFVEACLANNLSEAVCRADPECLAYIRNIVMYLNNCVSAKCWGNEEKVTQWRNRIIQEEAEATHAALERAAQTTKGL